ncbi:MAG: DUF4007 family protein [Lachnospiraceae bacterium]|nr:DUF4007 family protein [Lachnospiraceae bacterium]
MKIRLQGHEKFSLRDGWITKGLMQLSDKPNPVFSSDNAPDVFGIGSNMVKSLRFWMKAFGLTEDVKGGVVLSEFGRIVKENDLYLENIFTVWMLHSNLVKNKETASSWYVFFNNFDLQEFDKETVMNSLSGEMLKLAEDGSKGISQKSLGSDVDVLLGMYSKNKEFNDPEDKNSSPFAQLGLIKQVEGKKYDRVSPDKRIINEYLVLFEIAERFETQESVSIDTLLYGENSLSAIYHMNSLDLNGFLDRLQDEKYIVVNRTAGLDVIYKDKEISKWEVLEHYYKA